VTELGDALTLLIERAEKVGITGMYGRQPDKFIWQVLSALRGPDDGDSNLKNLTTARVRSIFGLEACANSPTGAIVNDIPLPHRQIVRRNELLKKSGWHFKSHFEQAMSALQRLGYDVPEAERRV